MHLIYHHSQNLIKIGVYSGAYTAFVATFGRSVEGKIGAVESLFVVNASILFGLIYISIHIWAMTIAWKARKEIKEETCNINQPNDKQDQEFAIVVPPIQIEINFKIVSLHTMGQIFLIPTKKYILSTLDFTSHNEDFQNCF